MIKFRYVRVLDHRTEIQIRLIDVSDIGAPRFGALTSRLIDGSEVLSDRIQDEWHLFSVADNALFWPSIYDERHAKTCSKMAVDDEFIARVNIRNPFDPDTWDWRDVTWIGPKQEMKP